MGNRYWLNSMISICPISNDSEVREDYSADGDAWSRKSQLHVSATFEPV